jgi:methylase of polypeptide subunit release factors
MLGFSNEADFERARNVLTAADYTESGFADKLGRPRVLSVGAVERPPWLRCTRDLSPLDTLIRLFLLGQSVPQDAAQAAIAPMSLDGWISAGLLAPANDNQEVVPRLKLLPMDDLILGSDQPRRWIEHASPDFVMAPGLTTVELAHAKLGTPSKRTLDLGTGCGALGLLAASHSEKVVATDTNPRAVAFARFNARLNRIDNVSCREGNAFEPIESGERFDLIVSNPPFVISPSKRFEFRDAGMRGDEFCRRLIRAVPSYLNPSGCCQLKCNYAHRSGEDWTESLTSWFEGLGCDVIVWVERVEDASEYALTWITGTESHDLEKIPILYEQWMDYFDEEKIEAVSYLLVTMRRTNGPCNWTRIDPSSRQIVGPCSTELLNTFLTQDKLGPLLDGARLLEMRPRLAADVRVVQEHAMSDEGLRVSETRLCKMGGSRFVLPIEPHIGSLAARFDGTRDVRDVLGEMARALGQDAESTQQEGLALVRSLLDRGILEIMVSVVPDPT